MTTVDVWADPLGGGHDEWGRAVRIESFYGEVRTAIEDLTHAASRIRSLSDGNDGSRLASRECAPFAPHLKRALDEAIDAVQAALSLMEGDP